MDFKYQRKRLNEIPQGHILEELERTAKHFNYIEFGWRDFDKYANISANTVKKHFGGWKNGLEALRLHLKSKSLSLKPRPYAPNRIYSDKQLFDEMERVWKEIGQRPSRYEWEFSKPKIAYNTYKRRFGGWANACLRFIEYKMGSNILSDDFVISKDEKQKLQSKDKKTYNVEFVRNVPLSLRLAVLSRDNFGCVFCGRSPATDVGVRLHIDHIIPFANGGKSILENLQTLCEECNLGKSNKEL